MPEIGPFLYVKLKPGQAIPDVDGRSYRLAGEYLIFSYLGEDERKIEEHVTILRDNGYEVITGMAMTLDNHYDDPTLY